MYRTGDYVKTIHESEEEVWPMNNPDRAFLVTIPAGTEGRVSRVRSRYPGDSVVDVVFTLTDEGDDLTLTMYPADIEPLD